ncbi:coiled-coil domain-containing protein 33-like isoform X2 [Macrotis lagotis]|uniref:coiled-coil domain-containing protein 33-like isoform X2 n=1 Tax=Macrotis lagotis TaxID=92651 RepID=UPI003D689959
MPKKDSWNLTDPLGISVLPLSNRVYRKMMAGPRMALHVKKLSILRTKLKTITGGTPTVGLYFQVHSSERPDNFITPHNCMDVPVLNPIFLDTDLGTIRGSWAKDYILSEPGSVPETGQEPDPVAKTPETELMTEFYPFFMYKRLFGPSVEQAKPQEYSQETLEDLSIRWPHQKSVYRLQSKAQSTKALPKEKTNENSQLSQGTTQPSSSPDYPDLSVTQGHHSEVEKVNQSDALLQERKEVDNCQKALIKMANDILSLRKQVTSLETENNSLRQQVYAQEMMGQASPEDEEMIENMKQKLSQSTNEMRRLKDRVQQLQNELIRKNDLEKDLLLIQQSHQQQQKHLKTYQDKLQKMESLEQTVKNQEKVIQTMEKILEEKIKQPSRERLNALVSSLEQPPGKTMGPMGDSVPFDFYSVLLAENARLRCELDKPRHQSVPTTLKQQALPDFLSGTSDKLNLIVKLESAQNRIRTLEKELEESYRRLGQEKQNLTLKLLTQDHGSIVGSGPTSTEHKMKSQNTVE